MLPFSCSTDSYSCSSSQCRDAGEHRARGARARAADSAEADIVTSAPAQQRLDHVLGLVHAAGRGERQTGTRPCRIAIQRSGRRSSSRVESAHAGHDRQRLEVDVGLEEAVEEDEPVRAGDGEPRRKVRERGEERAELDRERDPHLRPHRADDVEDPRLDLVGRPSRVRLDRVDVQLERVGAGLLDQPRVPDPAAGVELPFRLAITGIRERLLAAAMCSR